MATKSRLRSLWDKVRGAVRVLGQNRDGIKKYLPIAVSIILLVVLVVVVPWKQVIGVFARIHPHTLVLLTVLSLVFYLIKVVRYWYMLRPMGIYQPLPLVGLTYIGAQPVTLLPAGELYRNTMLERYAGIPMAQSAPTFLLQGLLEGIVLAGLAIIGVFTIINDVEPVLIFAGVVLLVTIVLQRGWLNKHAPRVAGWINKLPFVNLNHQQVRDFSRHSQKILKPRSFSFLLALSIAAEFMGMLIVYYSVHGLGDNHLGLLASSIVYAVPIVISFATLLPGGLGAAEQSTFGLLLLFDVHGAVAVAATLLIRFFLTGTGLIFGWIAEGILWAFYKPKDARRARVTSG
jgi:uncharacterized protein (TIRG00374 family)